MNEDCGNTHADEGIMTKGTNETGYNMSYDLMVVPLIKAVQELDAKNTALTTRVTALE